MNSTSQPIFTFFILCGISDHPIIQLAAFLVILLIYLFTLGGNMTIFVLVCLDYHLHTPMYFFLCNLSMLDIACTTVTLHRIFLNFLTGNPTISFQACMGQMYVFASLTSGELLILTAMSYDRYVAICSPLRYHVIMSSRVRASIATVCWLTGFVQAFPMLVLFSRHSCFSSREVNHFFCDIMELLHLACHDVSTLELLNFVNALLLAVFPFFLTFSSYIFIVIAILKISSSTGRFKTFYTCSSHLTVIILLYTSLVCQYLIPVTGNTGKDFNKQFSLFNTALVPMLNPLIYSLKNKDVKNAFWSRCGMSS